MMKKILSYMPLIGLYYFPKRIYSENSPSDIEKTLNGMLHGAYLFMLFFYLYI